MKYHIIRWGGLGDHIFVSPVVRYLKNMGCEIVYSTTERGREIVKHDPNIDELIFTPDASVDDVRAYWDEEIKRVGADKVVNFSESIEVSLLKHPLDPKYNLPKYERLKECDVNAFDQSFLWAGIDPNKLTAEEKRPILYYTPEEVERVEKFFDLYDGLGWNVEPRKKMVVMWCLSGSGPQKVYPFTMSVMIRMLEKYEDLYFLTVGDEVCQLLEVDKEAHPLANRIIDCAGKWSVRETMLATKYAQVVVAPETGVLVASGQYQTPKVGILSSITRNHVTKYFENDYTLEAENVSCSPCFKLIYEKFQCPLHYSGATLCMGEGYTTDRIINRIEEVFAKHYEGFLCRSQKQLISHKAA